MTIVGEAYTESRPMVAASEPYIEALPAHLLFADPTYQRDLDTRRAVEMAGTFDRRLLGVLDVSRRDDGRYAILDGQHRHATVVAVTPLAHVVCNVYEGLTVEDEARLFHELNQKRKALSWWDTWTMQFHDPAGAQAVPDQAAQAQPAPRRRRRRRARRLDRRAGHPRAADRRPSTNGTGRPRSP
jgi:hypothetical protein